MGLFTKDPELDEEIAAVLLTPGKAARRTVARHQSRFLQLRRSGERLVSAVVDDTSPVRAAIVAGGRMFIFAPDTPTPERVTEVAQIDRASIPEPAAVCLNGLNLGFWLRLRRPQEAHTFVVQVNQAILAHRPRSVPRLYPNYYLEILTNAGVEPTRDNLVRLVERTVAMFGGQAGAFCAQCGDPGTFHEFLQTFAPTVVRQDQSHLVDEMVDWLWDRNPGFHYGIERQLAKWRAGLSTPGETFVDNGIVPPWGWENGAEEAAEMWSLVFHHTELVDRAPC